MITNTDQLLELLPTRRWFGAKQRQPVSAAIVDQTVLDAGPPPLVAAIVNIGFADGGAEIYHLSVLAHGDGRLEDPFEGGVHRLASLGQHMAHGDTLRGVAGSFRFTGAGLDPLAPPGAGSVRAVGSEQSNSSVIFDDAVILKLLRRLEPGPNPELELSRLLTHEGFEHIPAQVGELRYEPEGDSSEEATFDLGLAQSYLSDATDGWEHTLAHVRRLYDRAEALAAHELETAVEDRASAVLDDLGELGEVTAALHVVLAREDLEPDVAAEPVDAQDLKQWAERAHEFLDGADDDLPQDLARAAARIIDALASLRGTGSKTRVHGDYHLGQVMLTARGWMILDFEGEPARSLYERRAKESPLRDAAGMLRSFSYAATAGLFERSEPGTDEWLRLQPWARTWEELARDRFLRSYLRTAHEGGFLPSDEDTAAIMLAAFEIEKALYELAYERGHRPRWIRIPLEGIKSAVARRDRG